VAAVRTVAREAYSRPTEVAVIEACALRRLADGDRAARGVGVSVLGRRIPRKTPGRADCSQ
jgi:hypothetical protein